MIENKLWLVVGSMVDLLSCPFPTITLRTFERIPDVFDQYKSNLIWLQLFYWSELVFVNLTEPLVSIRKIKENQNAHLL